MDLHHIVSGISQRPGLFIFFAIFLAVLVYAYWPKNRAKFDHIARSVFEEDDRPCP